MFQFRRFPAYAYLIQRTLLKYCFSGFPHSEIPGSMDICSSPRLIAACHVLHRLLMPRHSPCALSSLTLRTISFRYGSQLNYAGNHKELFWQKLYLPFTFRCCSTIKLCFLPNFTLERPLCCLAYHFRLFFVQFSRYNFFSAGSTSGKWIICRAARAM